MPRTLIVDANPLLSALLGGAALPILCDPGFRFLTTEKTTWEVKRYIPTIVEKLKAAGKTAWTESRLERLFHQFINYRSRRSVMTSTDHFSRKSVGSSATAIPKTLTCSH